MYYNNILCLYIYYLFNKCNDIYKNRDLSGNMLKGYVPHIQNLTECKIQYNEEMCFLENSKCGFSLEGSDLNKIKQCIQQQIEVANNNNNYEDEIEDTNQTSNDNSNGNNSNGSYYEPKNKNSFKKSFLIVVSVGIVIILVKFFVIFKIGNRKPKFNKFDDDRNNNNGNDIKVNDISIM